MKYGISQTYGTQGKNVHYILWKIMNNIEKGLKNDDKNEWKS